MSKKDASKMLFPASTARESSLLRLLVYGGLAGLGSAELVASENATHLVLGNDRLYAGVEKASGAMVTLELDGQDLLGPRSGSLGAFYLDCYW